jgi:tungstate transport system ATP-binding protein
VTNPVAIRVPALRARRLRKSFPTGFVLSVEELALTRGGFYGFVGPNGSGKTVLFEALALVAPPDEGEVELFGRAIFPDRRGWERVREQMALVMQRPYLFRGNLAENVAYGLRVRGVRRREREHRVQAALASLGLDELARTDVRHLSGGERKRTAIAQALVLEPEVLLLDEPTAHVDDQHARGLEALLGERCRDRHTTVLLSTHDLEQAYRLSDEVFLLLEGHCCPFPHDGPPGSSRGLGAGTTEYRESREGGIRPRADGLRVLRALSGSNPVGASE